MDYKLIENCRACGHELNYHKEQVFSYGVVPLAGNFCKTQELAYNASKYPLSLTCCPNCETVQVMHDIDDRVLFSEYNYSSSTIGGLNRHFVAYAELLTERYNSKEKINFLEIGCNDGVLLKKLPGNWTKIGVDPSDVALRNADSTYELYNKPFSKELVEASGLIETCDVISGSNCLAHISEIKNVFEGVWMALKKGGDFYIEVHNLYATFDDNQWETIYHEHKIEWDIVALQNCLLPLGFEFVEVSYLPLHGGLIRAQFRKSNFKNTERILSPEKHQLLKVLHQAYLNRYDNKIVKLLEKQDSKKVVAYGAAGRAVMFLNHMDQLHFNTILDDSPIRVGKFIPTIGIEVKKSDELFSGQYEYSLVTAWNYFDDIVKQNAAFKGQWLKYFNTK